MTTVELVQGYASGAVSNDALIWKAGMEEWQSPFDIPALALALQARGFARPAMVPSARKEPQGGGTPLPPTASAADWEGDDAPTRVADSSLRFPGRPQRGADGHAPQETEGPKPDGTVQVEQHWNEEDDEETLALGGNSSGRAASQKVVDFDDEATEVIAPDRARELLASESSKYPSAPPLPKLSSEASDEEGEATQIIAEDRAEALLAAQIAPRPSDVPPSQETGVAAPVFPRPAPAPPPRGPAKTASGSGRAPPIPSRPPRQPPRPRPLTAEPNTPLDAASVPPVAEKAMIPTPKPAAGTPPLASLAPPKPSSAPPPGPTPVAPPPEPERAAEPTIVVAEPKPARPPEAALVTLPRQRPPTPPGTSLRTMQNEPTRVVRVVSKGPGFAFWVVLILALAAAAAGGFVVSQMLRERGTPSWLKRP
jgi:hypothetical protein